MRRLAWIAALMVVAPWAAAQEADVSGQLAAARAAVAELQARVDANRERIAREREALMAQSEGLDAGLANFESSARETLERLRRLSEHAYPATEFVAAGERVPDAGTLSAMADEWLGALKRDREPRLREATVYDRAGRSGTRRILEVGGFLITDGSHDLRFDPATGSLYESAAVLSARDRERLAGAMAPAAGPAPLALLDPTGGALSRAGLDTLRPREIVRQGGTVGVVILVLGALGLLVAGWRGLALLLSGWRIRRQIHRRDASTGNALGRVLAAGLNNSALPVEEMERHLDEAIMRETPVLERGQALVKVIAAVAPLLGLLGTVVGMIRTFNTITVFGASNPALMAGGISQALVTTMLGLLVAIPLVLMHSLLVSMSRAQVEIIEEQSAGLLARRLSS